MRPFLALTLLTAFLGVAALSAPAAADEPVRTITVTGRGEVSVEPDMATVVIGVQAESEAAADALDQASAATAAILATLDVEGVLAEDIQSGAIRLNPRYNRSMLSSGNQIIGYQAVNSVEVRVKNLDQLGGLLAAVVGDGANRLDRVSFGLQDPSKVQDEARRLAVAEAQRLAMLYAEAAGVSVGELLVISEGGVGGRLVMEMTPVVVMEERVGSSPQFDVPVAPGKIDLNASINMVFAIAD